MDWVESVGTRTRVAYARSGEAFRDETARLQDEVTALTQSDPSAFGQLVRAHGIPRRRLLSIVDGWNAYYIRGVSRDARQLDALLRQWSGAPMVLGVEAISNGQELTPDTVRALQHLGMARGLLELMLRLDAELDRARFVFPLDELERFRVSREDLSVRRRPPGFHDLCWFQLQRAREWASDNNGWTKSLSSKSAQILVTRTREWCVKTATAIEKSGYALMGEARRKARLDAGW
jgi:phytoene/squalene synthetase